LTACDRTAPSPRLTTVATAIGQTSASCRECHQELHAAWAPTDHANANRPVSPARDAAALKLFTAAAPGTATPEFILGQKPAWQPLVPFPGGRWQPHEQAFDPARREFFNVFGSEGRQPGEWGHWTGRGMNWNSQCAHCHMTGYQRRYDAAGDSYRSTWVEHGVGCIQCHGPMPTGHGDRNQPSPPGPKPPFHGDRHRMMQTCAPCHARNEQLTEKFQPGDNYHDHYRVVLPVDAATYYADGQQRDEDFNWTSVLLSRMGHAGVTCLDCHDPHTTRTILPVADNQLCLQCHAAPGRKLPGGAVAVAIDAVTHSKHQPGSPGNSCVACHMPTTTYMQRSPRHDHGWLSPDPQLTRELGIPNACSNCHGDQGLDWNIARSDEWYGHKVRSRQRARARAITAAQGAAPGAADALVALLVTEDIPAWRATYLALLPATGDADKGRGRALAALQAVDPLERAAAARYFHGDPAAATLLAPLLFDPVRLVRVDAAWALSSTLPSDAAARRELDDYLALSLDQPAGRVRRAQDLANRGQFDSALAEVDQALAWDPHSAGIYETRALILSAAGQLGAAGEDFNRAAERSGQGGGALALQAGLAFAEAGRLAEAKHALQLAWRKDPTLHRAAYNLGLLCAQQGDFAGAIAALRAAEAAAPRIADYPYALATVLLRGGDHAGARAAAERALAIDPAHPGAEQFRTLSR
jgi:predicted CXXCH cytochrome family protein